MKATTKKAVKSATNSVELNIESALLNAQKVATIAQNERLNVETLNDNDLNAIVKNVNSRLAVQDKKLIAASLNVWREITARNGGGENAILKMFNHTNYKGAIRCVELATLLANEKTAQSTINSMNAIVKASKSYDKLSASSLLNIIHSSNKSYATNILKGACFLRLLSVSSADANGVISTLNASDIVTFS